MTLVQKELYAGYIGEWYLVPTSISLDESSISLTTVWQTEQLTATILPADARDTVTWTSSNTSIATVDNTWLVTCVTPWECTITATTVNGLTATCSVRANLVYDFTTQDVLTYGDRQNSYTWYGWSSWNWYYSYIQNSSYYRTNTTRLLPTTDFTWTLNKIRLTMNVPNNYSGGWVATAKSNAVKVGWGLGCWDANNTNRMTKSWPSYYSYTYSSWIQTLVIDLVNLTMYVEWNSSTAISLTSSEVSSMRTSWTNKSLWLNAVANYPNGSWYYTYLRKLEISTS